jgi:hypothetical protein
VPRTSDFHVHFACDLATSITLMEDSSEHRAGLRELAKLGLKGLTVRELTEL